VVISAHCCRERDRPCRLSATRVRRSVGHDVSILIAPPSDANVGTAGVPLKASLRVAGVGVWPSPGAHLVRDEGVAGSNPATPTNKIKHF
jgi:hypothetical protein